MAIEKGMTAKLEDAIAAVLAALQYEGENLFETAEAWQHQLESGHESFARFQPFAFVTYNPFSPGREGDFDLNDKLRFTIGIGVTSKTKGIAKRGDTNNVGGSKIRDLVIDAIDKWHPGGSFDCDEFEYINEDEILDAPKKYTTELHFMCNWLRD